MNRFAIAALVTAAVATTTLAQSLNVGPSTVIPTFGTPWYSTGNSGGGSSAIVSYTGIDGDGAASIAGDRTRFAIGNMFPSNSSSLPSVGPLSALSTFNYRFNIVSQGAGVATAQAPALRLHVLDNANNRRIEFIYEDGEQSVPQFVGGAGSLGTVYSGDFFGANSRVYAFTAGFGRGIYDAGGSLIAGSDAAQQLSSLIVSLNNPNATITGVSLGVGSSVGSGFLGYADNVNFGFTGGQVLSMNFVPTPGAAALLGVAGLAATRRRR